MKTLAFGLAILACVAGTSKAASVGFTGVFEDNLFGGGTGFIGDVETSPVTYGDVVGGANFSAFAIDNTGALGNGQLLLSAGGPIFVINGTSTWVDNGTDDDVSFELAVTTTDGGTQNGTITFSFDGDLISGGNGYSEANLDEFLNGSAFFSGAGDVNYVDQSGGNLNFYGGTANAVPEPGSLSMLIALGCGVFVRRRRS